jgi:DNA-binding NtrC family response regulator
MTDPRKQARIRVLVADDQPSILEAVELLLQPQGIQVDTVRSPQLLLEALGQSDYDVLLIDLNYTRDTTSGKEGLDLLARLQEIDPRLPVIVMTAWGNIDLAVESIKRGARDFIQKPWENERLISIIRVHAELRQALRRARQLELENRLLRSDGMPEFIASRAVDAACSRTHRPNRPLGRQRAHHRRARDWQRDCRAAFAHRLSTLRACRWWR